MPNITGLSVNQGGYLVQVTYGNGGHAEVTQAEAQAYVDSHPTWTDARLEDWAVQQLQARWAGRTDTPYVHLVARSPVAIQALVTNPGITVGANWWAE